MRIETGDTIDLGRDSARRRVHLEVPPLGGHATEGLTLLDPVSRVLYAGDSLGTQGTAGLILTSTLAQFTTALASWRSGTDRRYDTLYTAHNHQWFTRPAYVDSLAAAAAAGLADDGAYAASPLPGHPRSDQRRARRHRLDPRAARRLIIPGDRRHGVSRRCA
ncbi:MAG TPA: MBL fold metallo-hydrolase [Microlunatus sp.]|nr:MBL fold metallo-hydrolase [Microlunatus sp.]